MRWILLGLVGVACFMTGAARAQAPSEKEAIRQLEKHEIRIDRDPDQPDEKFAEAYVESPEVLKALALLRYVKGLTWLKLDIADVKLAKGCFNTIPGSPGLRKVRILANRLPDADFQKLAALSKLESLSLQTSELTEMQLQALGELKNLKKLTSIRLELAHLTSKALERLKRDLPQVEKIEFVRMPSIFFMDPLAIAPAENLVMKLQKQKVNAAIAAITTIHADIRLGLNKDTYYDSKYRYVELMRDLRSAALDLDDPRLTTKFIDDYVLLAERAHADSKSEFDAGKLAPYKYHRFAYEYADAQLLQLRLKKQAEAKAK